VSLIDRTWFGAPARDDATQRHKDGMRNLIFTCPVANQNVQHRIETPSDRDYESVKCLACAGVHFINLKTGKVLRRDKE
jgi:hypothetical protein